MAMTEPALFAGHDDDLLIRVYEKQGRTLDDLPYTEEFEHIVEAVALDGSSVSTTERAAILHRLQNLRKSGRLPRLGRTTAERPRIDAEHEHTLRMLVQTELGGGMGGRDQLPYTLAFDRIAESFATDTGLRLEARDLWRLIAKLAK